MLKITFISDAGTPISTKLCESTRSLAEHDFEAQGESTNQVESIVRATRKKGFDRGNRRISISFNVWRAENFAATAFASPEAALAFALDHIDGMGGDGTQVMGSSGSLKIELTGQTTRYIHNCLLNSIQKSGDNGLCLLLRYSFTGGLIDTTP